ncbi:hypothetical protein [Marinitoga sp. 38H-ov]|uniref:hypothetical protein n=1 Tax=Marinitoga sp. 38H-ov TaxID=1755814 RepID=UPI0019D16805|nr:hypothetical protein [Marinitoga sp. 38H-ov]
MSVILLTMLLLNTLTTFYISNLNNNNVPNPDIFYKNTKNLNIEKEFLQSKEYTLSKIFYSIYRKQVL